MSKSRWAISLLLTMHLAATALGSVPPPGSLREIEPPRHPTGDPLAAAVTPTLDRVAAVVPQVSAMIWDATGPVPGVARGYLRSMGLGQQWTMFFDPPKRDEYVRLRYYVGSTGLTRQAKPSWIATELVFPALREDEFRVIRSYWNKPQDKTILTAIRTFLRRRDVNALGPDTKPNQLPADLIPMSRFFRTRFERDHLTPSERVLRTDVWRGTAPVPVPGVLEGLGDRKARLDALRRYYDGPIDEPLPGGVFPPYHAIDQEADIVWLLEYFEEQ